MNMLLHNWHRVVDGQAVSIRGGNLYVDGDYAGRVSMGVTVEVCLKDHRTIEAGSLESAAQAAVRHIASERTLEAELYGLQA